MRKMLLSVTLMLAMSTLSWGDSVPVWPVSNATQVAHLTAAPTVLTSVHRGRWLCAIGAGRATVLDQAGRMLRAFSVPMHPMQASPYGDAGLVLLAGGRLARYNVVTGQRLESFDGYCDGFAIAPDASDMLVETSWSQNAGHLEGTGQFCIRQWSLVQTRRAPAVVLSDESYNSYVPLGFVPNHRFIALYGDAGMGGDPPWTALRLFKTGSAEPLCSLELSNEVHVGVADCLGHTVVVAGQSNREEPDKGAVGFFTVQGDRITPLSWQYNDNPYKTVAMTPDGRVAATLDEKQQVVIWNVATQKPVATLANHATAIALSDDGHALWTATSDGHLLRWALKSF